MATLSFSGSMVSPQGALGSSWTVGRAFVPVLVSPPSVMSGAFTVKRKKSFSGAMKSPVSVLSASLYTPYNQTWDAYNGTWGEAQFAYSQAIPVMLIGNTFNLANDDETADGDPVQVTLVRTGLTIFGRDRAGNPKEDPGLIKECTGIWPAVKGRIGDTIQLSMGQQDNPDDPVTWEGPYDFVIGVDVFQDFTVSGRYLAVRFQSRGMAPWELSSYDLDLELVGTR